MTLTDNIRNALRSVSRSIPDAVMTMTHGDRTGSAIRCSSNDIGADVASESGPIEKRRVIVSSADFPALTAGCYVTVDGDSFLTTSATQDPVGASTKVGLSDALEQIHVTYNGTRRVDGAVRKLSMGIGLLGIQRDKMSTFGEALAPVETVEWYMVVPKESWPEAFPPECADQLLFYTDRQHRLKVADVTERDGFWLLLCRSR